MTDIIVRELRVTDLEVVWSINQENVPAVGEETLADLSKIHDQSTIALVAEVSDQIVGFCMVLLPGADYGSPNYEFFCDRLDNFIYLDRVAVTENFQGMGIGSALYREVEMRADAEWFALEVNTKPRNEGSLRFHAREGFVQMEELETRPGKTVSLMVKKLKG
ncbi:MAG: hypothetical protein RL073_156 [Actinomycetota bacterium]|jgi:predicted GNAT superfamily acetyltransferase